jgi:hypothetical protein
MRTLARNQQQKPRSRLSGVHSGLLVYIQDLLIACPLKSHLEMVESKYMYGRSVADGLKASIVCLCVRHVVFCQPPPFTLQAIVTPPLRPLTLHCGAVAGSCMAAREAVTELAGQRQAPQLKPADAMQCSGSTAALRVLSRSPRAQLCIHPGSHGHSVPAAAQIAGSPAPCTAAQMICHKLGSLIEW